MAQTEQAAPTAYAPNFVFPIRDLESSRVKLTLFIPALHAKEFFEETTAHPELYKYCPPGPFNSVNEFIDTFIEEMVHKNPDMALFAILDKTGETPRLAGVICLLVTSVADQSIEIGFVVVFPAFHRTHVTSNAVGLLVHYCLELPASSAEGVLKYGPGLGLRRVQWQAHAENGTSVRTAERMSFRREGIIRWQRVLREGKFGFAVPPEREALRGGPGRHTCMLSLCWDDWELEGAREAVQQQMDRPSHTDKVVKE